MLYLCKQQKLRRITIEYFYRKERSFYEAFLFHFSNYERMIIEWNVVTEKSFYNELKRGDLIVKKTSEDGFIEGMRFHLFGTSLSGIAVDEYASTDSDGIAYFNDILIGTGYTIEEVNTPTEPLFLGKFEFREEKAPYGMVLLEEPIQVELVYAGQEVKITTTAASAVNERQKVVISPLKKLETDDHYGIGLGSEYENISVSAANMKTSSSVSMQLKL